MIYSLALIDMAIGRSIGPGNPYDGHPDRLKGALSARPKFSISEIASKNGHA
jgi:hypothetical protein